MSRSLQHADRSGVSAYYRCERQFYWERIHDGGIEPVARRLWAVIGSAGHRGLTAALKAEDVDAGADAAVRWLRGTLAVRPALCDQHWRLIQPPADWPTSGYGLVEGLVRRWWHHRGHEVLSRHTVAAIESPIRWQLTPGSDHVLEIQPDVLLLDPHRLAFHPLDFKLSSRLDEDWRRSWAVQPQVIAYMAAIEQPVDVPWRPAGEGRIDTGVICSGMTIEGIDRGEIRNLMFTSPLVSGYAMSRTVTDIAQMSPTRLNKQQRRVHVPVHQTRAWVQTVSKLAAPGFIETVRLDRPTEIQVAQYRDLVHRHIVTVRTRQEYNAPAEQWPMTGLVTGECCSPQRRCPYAHLCFPGQFEPLTMQPRDPHHNPYLGDGE